MEKSTETLKRTPRLVEAMNWLPWEDKENRGGGGGREEVVVQFQENWAWDSVNFVLAYTESCSPSLFTAIPFYT
jgi:hypothetical protein